MILSRFIVIVLLIAALCLLAPLGASRGGKEPSPNDAVCTTKGCVLAANQLIQSINTSVDPCENFFEFACGQWNRDHPIPDDVTRYSTIVQVKENIAQQMRGLFESSTSMESRAMEMVRTVYKACMNITQLGSLKSTPLLSVLDSIGGWPVLGAEPYNATEFDMTKLLAMANREFGIEPFFIIRIAADERNTTKNIIHLDQGGPRLSRDFYLNTTRFASQLAGYKKFQRKFVELLIEDGNYSRSKADVEADLSEMFEFETKFAEITVRGDERRNSTRMYNMRRIGNLVSLMPKVDWVRFFRMISPPKIHELINNDTELVVSELGFMKDMTRLLEKTDGRVIVNYVLWRAVFSARDLLDSRFNDLVQDLMKSLSGREKKPTRWEFCVEKARDALEFASAAIYVREYFDSNEKKEALKMIDNLQRAFEEIIRGNDWMEDATKKVAIEKLDLQPSDSYVTLSRKLDTWDQDYYMMQLTEDVDRTKFNGNPAVVDAYYNAVKNAITFPAGILQPPFFSGDFPKMVNYGAIGTVIGHEMTHGFDDQGSQYDKDGNLRDWWSAKSKQRFANRTKCIVDQYSSYELPRIKVNENGKLTEGENIADNGGLKETYRAYRQYVKKLGHEEPRLPGLQEFSSDQIFFLSFAHFWCGSSKEKAALQNILINPHSPSMFRVIGVLSNLDEFSKAFKCAPGTPLNPKKKCTVW